ncbi:hypothetical protein B0J13DRAFT_295836 [Dactylonectria estremocensis]|uniref:Uncharacterized protein n=1 Tax=Dactylonectria estremocensis TaxID=1079267 RepID=A0A9P9EZY9_9HYPO|nr:hypothetical protein B0J13DRAFT_295836 [Dactylonectria estremocensis]
MLDTPDPLDATRRTLGTKKAAARPTSSTKFEFVASDPAGKPDPGSRRFIRSHVMRGKNTKQCRTEPQSLAGSRTKKSVLRVRRDGQGGQTEFTDATDPTQAHCFDFSQEACVQAPCLSGCLRAPTDLKLFSFAAPLDGLSLYLIFRFLTTVKDRMYPIEWCFQQDHTKVCWFRWLLEDHTYLQSVLFMASAFQDLIDAGVTANDYGSRGFSRRTQSHLGHTIRLLQEKIQDRERQIEDTTMSAVSTLAMVADAAGDSAGFEAHVRGLKDMVRMRGGLVGLEHNRQLQMKLCRIDLGWSIKNGSKPDLYDGQVSWEPFLEKALSTNIRPSVRACPSGVERTIELWDYRLKNVFTDLQGFSAMANVFIPSHQKLKPELFQEIMLSIQYRLLLLEYPVDVRPLEESIRIGLISFESTLVLHTPKLGVKLTSDFFYHQLRRGIENIRAESQEIADLKLWLLLVGSIIVFKGDETWLLDSINELVGDQPWADVRSRAKRVMWIDVIHDGPGQHAFDTAKRGPVV